MILIINVILIIMTDVMFYMEDNNGSIYSLLNGSIFDDSSIYQNVR